MVVRPRTAEVGLAFVHLSRPMLSGCDAYEVYSNESLQELAFAGDALRLHIRGDAIQGGMDSSFEGWPPENPVTYSANNTGIFLQAWHAIVTSGIYERFDWTVKVDPDTVLFPDRLRLLLRARSPDVAEGLFDGGALCKTGMGGIGVLSRAAVKVVAAAEKYLPDMHVTREDGMLKGMLNNWGRESAEPNLLLNPVPELDCSRAPWKAAYHPFKDVYLVDGCWRNSTARSAASPTPSELHSACL